MQDATGNCHTSEIVEKLLRLEPLFTFPPDKVTELNILEKGMACVAVDK